MMFDREYFWVWIVGRDEMVKSDSVVVVNGAIAMDNGQFKMIIRQAPTWAMVDLLLWYYSSFHYPGQLCTVLIPHYYRSHLIIPFSPV